MATGTCPKCGSAGVKSHCDSHQCDLIRCGRCGAFGTPDGRLWRVDGGK